MISRGAAFRAPAPPSHASPFGGCRTQARGLSRARLLRFSWLVCLAACCLVSRRSVATLVDEPFVGGVGFAGPTSGDPAAIYWNPAAVGVTQDWAVQISGNVRLDKITVDRAPLQDGTTFPRANSRTWTQPVAWPLGPGSFAGFFKDLGDRFTLAFATYRPFEEHLDYTVATGSEPTRFHRVSSQFGNTAFTPAVAIRLADGLRIGLSLTSLLSTGHLVLDEPGPTGLENDPNSTRLNLDSGTGLGDAHFSWLIGGGVYFRRRTWSAGLAFATRPIGSGVEGIALTAGRSRLTRADGSTVNCPDGVTPGCTYADIIYRLPFLVTGGASFFPKPGLEVAVFERLQIYPSGDRIDIRITSPEVGSGSAQPLPTHVVLARGATHSFDTRVRAAYWIREWCRVGLGARFETGAVPTDLVNAGAVDGPKLGPYGAVQIRALRHVWLQGGYAFTYQLPVTVSSSAFQPEASSACAADAGDLNNPACRARLQGLARPTAAGTYQRVTHDFTLGLLLSF